jgi:tripartite-type tricarboxylate transporter receptor subunit TctC
VRTNQKRVTLASRVALILFVVVVAGSLAACAPSVVDKAAAWPEKDITLIVPFKPGGGYDIISRIVAPLIEKYLPKKVNVVVKNVDGAAGTTGMMEVLNSKPDGYTIGMFDFIQVGQAAALGQMEKYDPYNLTWIAECDRGAGLLIIQTNGKFKNIGEMKGQEVRFSSTGQTAFANVIIGKALGATPRIILFDASGDAATAVAQGNADAFVTYWPSQIRYVKSNQGKVTAVFLADDKRDPNLPDMPTAAEMGVDLKGGIILGGVHVLASTGGWDPAIKTKFVDVVKKAMADPDFKANMVKAGYPPTVKFDKELQDEAKSILDDLQSYKDLIKQFQQQ